MKISIFQAIVAALVVLGCSPNPRSSNLNREIQGEWRNIYLKISLNEKSAIDSVRITECDSTNWERMLGIKPIHTFFNPDGSFRSDYYTLKDSLFMSNNGTWTVSGDTLTMSQISPKPAVYKLKTILQNGVATFEGMIDFDGDGESDDHYLGKQRKQ